MISDHKAQEKIMDEAAKGFEEWLAKEIKASHTESIGRMVMSLAEDYKEVWQAAKLSSAKEIEQLKQRLEIAVEHLKFTTHAAEYLYKPDVKLNKNMTPTFYFTLTYEGDLELVERCKGAMEFLAKIKAEKEQ